MNFEKNWEYFSNDDRYRIIHTYTMKNNQGNTTTETAIGHIQ